MHNISVAFEILEDGEKAPIRWSKVTGHLVFDAKMALKRKARWVLDGHETPDVIGSAHAGVASHESVPPPVFFLVVLRSLMPTSAIRVSKHHHHRRTASFVDLNLDLRMQGKWL